MMLDRWNVKKIWHLSVPPMAAPRQVQRDQSPAAKRYRAYKQELRLLGIEVPHCGYWLVFGMPMPKSWPRKKREKMWGSPHLSKPDKDNLEKAILDAIYADDRKVWDGRVSKVWTTRPMIILLESEWCPWMQIVIEEADENPPSSWPRGCCLPKHMPMEDIN